MTQTRHLISADSGGILIEGHGYRPGGIHRGEAPARFGLPVDATDGGDLIGVDPLATMAQRHATQVARRVVLQDRARHASIFSRHRAQQISAKAINQWKGDRTIVVAPV